MADRKIGRFEWIVQTVHAVQQSILEQTLMHTANPVEQAGLIDHFSRPFLDHHTTGQQYHSNAHRNTGFNEAIQ